MPNVKDDAILSALSVKELKEVLQAKNIPYSDCLEKSEMVQRVKDNLSKF